ncbi:uncharacterized protein CCOS01_16963 [Colletotrichum costaricense]|uniref:Uncharacterized protein n=2 Tax=Colletotrichum acutatum species complex TaxID=2707335 RepID=A0AAI9YEJ8_9PEZI|nr:uncharacterized protein CCOS01_16963 [Colletotrichum costaricense]KAK0367651.1 hypothetical protein CLIM01_14992 [Colletotrichum limetticola]KAK1503888.1 hypothetical protein CCOS01_16963 [Colletotrichum costaricense]
MCNYTQHKYHCGHTRKIASWWCPLYEKTHRRCPPCVTWFENHANQTCGDCKPRTEVAWESMINR